MGVLNSIILLLLFIICQNKNLVNSQNQLIESECNRKLIISTILFICKKIIASKEHPLDTTFNGYSFCSAVALDPYNHFICNNKGAVCYFSHLGGKKSRGEFLMSIEKLINIILNLKYNNNIDLFKVENNFLIGKFPNTLTCMSLFIGNSSLFDVEIGFNKIIQVESLSLLLYLSGPLNIYFSSFLNVQKFQLKNQTQKPKYKINFINDLNDTTTAIFNIYNIYSHNIPSVKNINLSILFVFTNFFFFYYFLYIYFFFFFFFYPIQLTLLGGADIYSFSIFSKFSNVIAFSITPSDKTQIYPFPIALSEIPAEIKILVFQVNYSILMVIFHFLDYQKICFYCKYIQPIVKSEFKNGNLGKFKNINEKLTNIKYIKFQNNSIKTPLPS
ncbi:hypothetical protein DDB_G0286435 [Dictyostelium discoideum AX4]|uniref:hypothetical protein n=1 Tax=Dictyostelium discoideum AX4 TaxID=352472 RepID=UPI00004E538D|nr:hypothetical protein DDB_G0286435 [Dictyostelium discoideum AX4]EAL64242.1 hypothetical protein DDB_G0286435 [Dictyostelium discoideum AX4]|eukprot:XP_637754.1 hypothetical protein DDB_G0286435 [Dictyostelium discoideum AX4]